MTTPNGDICAHAIGPSSAGDGPVLVAPAALDDSALCAALARDLDAAFESYVIAYRQPIVTFVARMLGDSAAAEDVAQDVFVRAYRALQTYPPERRAALRLRSWTYAIAHNLTRNAVRAAPPATQSLAFADGHERAALAVDPSRGPESLAARAETWREVQSAIARLSPRLRPAYVMRYLDDLSYDEIAQALHAPVGTVKAAAHRAAISVRSFLEHDHD